jgi:hypothetical protein
MNTNKPLLTKEQAEGIEVLRKSGRADDEILSVAAGRQGGWAGRQAKELNEMNSLTLAKALINGYEVEKSPEDELAEHYGRHRDIKYDYLHRHHLDRAEISRESFSRGFTFGVERALNALDVKIKGVND